MYMYMYMYLDFHTSYYLLHKIDLNFGCRYMTWMAGVSGGKPLIAIQNLQSSRYSFGGGARDRPVSAQTFTGRSTSKSLNRIFVRTHR